MWVELERKQKALGLKLIVYSTCGKLKPARLKLGNVWASLFLKKKKELTLTFLKTWWDQMKPLTIKTFTSRANKPKT
jgi:hypothetical protein